jgi:hypothetical protein
LVNLASVLMLSRYLRAFLGIIKRHDLPYFLPVLQKSIEKWRIFRLRAENYCGLHKPADRRIGLFAALRRHENSPVVFMRRRGLDAKQDKRDLHAGVIRFASCAARAL